MKKIAIDETILVKDKEAKAGSHIMEGFKSLFSAEPVIRLENKGYDVSEMTAVGEFGLDLVGEFSYGKEQTGKLSGDAASKIAAGSLDGALAVDMTGAPRRAAAVSGITFLKPTYGTVSRYGVISCAASGEQVGAYAKSAEVVAEIMGVIAGHDEKDGTSLPAENYEYSADADIKGKKIAYVTTLADKADADVKKALDGFASGLEKKGAAVEKIDCDLFETANIAWQILMSAETCNNVSRYDGVKFGYAAEEFRNIDELYINTRTEGFNFLTKSVILYGSDALSKARYADCYDKSLRVRRVVADAFAELFKKYDAILIPPCSTYEFESYDIQEAFGKVFAESEFTAAANLIGIPAAAGCGVQLLGDKFSESTLLSLLKSQER